MTALRLRRVWLTDVQPVEKAHPHQVEDEDHPQQNLSPQATRAQSPEHQHPSQCP